MDFSPADHKVHCELNQISNKLFRWLCVCVCYLDVVLPVELGGFLLWQTTGAVLQWGENGGGNVDVVTLHRAQIINYGNEAWYNIQAINYIVEISAEVSRNSGAPWALIPRRGVVPAACRPGWRQVWVPTSLPGYLQWRRCGARWSALHRSLGFFHS